MWEVYLNGGKSITILCSSAEFKYLLEVLKDKYELVVPIDLEKIQETAKTLLTEKQGLVI